MGEILSQRFRGEDWVFQACEAVRNGVQNCFDNLRQQNVAVNSQPGDQYMHAARTREDLLATQEQVADARQVNTQRRPPAPPQVILPVDETQVRDPLVRTDDGNGDQQRNDDGTVSWML